MAGLSATLRLINVDPIMSSEKIADKILHIERTVNLSNVPSSGESLILFPYSDLSGAVSSLVQRGRKVAIVTGFYVPGADPPAAETDGPPGALVLAEGLAKMGMDVLLLSDQYTVPALRAGLAVIDLADELIPIISFPMEHPDENHPSRKSNEDSENSASLAFVRDFLNGPMGDGLTHLIFIERVGPNHTIDSFLKQERLTPPPLKEFEGVLSPPLRNRCYNSRLEDITRFTAKTHLLVEYERRPDRRIESIGIGDRGNEIGAGRIPWEGFAKGAAGRRDAVFCCRVATDYLLSSRISNWGGYALVAGLALAKGRLDILEKITPEREKEVLDHIVRHGPAVDGLTGRRELSVDGVRFEDYINGVVILKRITLQ